MLLIQTVVRAQVQTPLTEDDISVSLAVVEDGANTPVTSLPLGAAAQLRLELINNNFQGMCAHQTCSM